MFEVITIAVVMGSDNNIKFLRLDVKICHRDIGIVVDKAQFHGR